MLPKNLHSLYALIILISLFLIIDFQRLPNTGINLKQLPKNGKQIPPPNKNNGKNNNNNRNKVSFGFLSIKNGNLFYNSRKIFLSGINLYYINYGQDFGNGNYYNVKTQYESYLKQISNAGGNAVRVLIHGTGIMTPKLGADGYASGEDTASLIQEIGLFLDSAKRNNIFVTLCLWEAEYAYTSDFINLFKQEIKLNSYINKVLKPLVSGLKKKKALAMYDVMSDPAASIMSGIVDSNPCYDTQDLTHQSASWAANNFTMKEIQRSLNRIFSAIKSADPKALVILVTNEQESISLCDWCFNYWQDKCLISAGGMNKGVLDIYSFNAFSLPGSDTSWDPLRKKASDYKLVKPILIGMTSANCSIVSKNVVANFNHAFNNGYAGIFNWRYTFGMTGLCNDPPSLCNSAMNALKSKSLVKVSIK